MSTSRSPLDPRLLNGIALVATILWVLNFAGRFFVPDYDPSPAVDAIMTLIVGGSLGSSFMKSRNGNGGAK